MLLLDFAVVSPNQRGGKKTNHGNQTNYKIDREYLSVNNRSLEFVLFKDAWSQKGHSVSNTTVILA